MPHAARAAPLERAALSLLAFTLVLSGCGGLAGQDDWYYHWSCNGDLDCLQTNPTGQPSGTLNEGPDEVNCTQLMEFAARFWGPAATNSCDHSPTAPPPALLSLEVTPANPTLALGRTLQLAATGRYADGSTKDLTAAAAWSLAGVQYIGDPVVLAVGATGLVTAVSQGSKRVQATLGALSGSTQVTIGPPALVSVAISPADATMFLDDWLQLTATGTYSDGSTANVTSVMVWSTSPADVASVGATGLAYGVAPGATTVTAARGTVSAGTSLTVAAATLQAITVTPAGATLAQGLAQQMKATGSWSNGSTSDVTAQVVWASGPPAVATVTAGGLATAVAPGTATVSATWGAVAGSTALTVGPVALQSIVVAPQAPIVTQGFTEQLAATGHYSDGHTEDLTASAAWTSATPAVATVSAGRVTALAPGTAAVTAASGGRSGGTTVSVEVLGARWRHPASGTTRALNAVVWCKERFVAVGAAGTLLTSPDGAEWTAQASGTGRDLYAVACSPTAIVAAGANGTRLTSADGASWADLTPPDANVGIYALVWAGTQWVAGGDWAYLFGTAAGLGDLATSPDGLAWTFRDTGYASQVRSLAWSGDRVLAVGGVTRSSTDGATWVHHGAGPFSSVTWTGSAFWVVGANGWIFRTVDGTTFDDSFHGTRVALAGLAWSGAQLTVVGDGGTVMTSPDGASWSWTVRDAGTTANLRGVAWSGARLVAVGDGGAVIVAP